MDVKLVSVSPKGTRKVFPVAGNVTTLGRQSDCDLQIPRIEISRRHCELHLNGRKVQIRDLKSANGTFVNGEKITQQELNPGDIVSLADVFRFCIQIDGKPQKIDDAELAPTAAAKKPVDKPTPKPAAKSAAPAAKPKPAPARAPAKVEDDDADDILGESFFLDMDEDDDDK